jgi:uncharacterized protein (DUF302 family)
MSAQQDTKVNFADPGAAAAAFQRSRISQRPLPEVVQRLKNAIEAADLWVLHEIDPQTLLQRGGYTIAAARQVLFFHPRLMARVLAADSAALLEAPLKFAAFEQTGGVMVRWIEPATAFARYGNPALAELGQELSRTCEHIIASLD